MIKIKTNNNNNKAKTTLHYDVQMHNLAGGAYRDVGVSGVPLGIGGGEDGVDEDEGPHDLSTQPHAGSVAVR